jgi:type I restriction enzyme S subunit
LGEVAQKITDGTHQTPVYVAAGVPFISVKDFSGGKLDFSSTRFISPDEHAQLYKRCDPRRGDILLGRIGTLGKAVLVDTDTEFSIFVSVALIRFSHRFTEPAFFRLLLNSPHTKLEFDRIKIGGATHTNKLNLGDLHTISVPLPPLAEQKRIVAKVDELMAVCDRLEAQQRERDTRHAALARAALARFAAAPTPDNLQYLFHPAYDIAPDDLRSCILELAVRGKLSQQIVSDGAAIENLRRSGVEMIWFNVMEKERRFPIPQTWVWMRFAGVGEQRLGKMLDGQKNKGALRPYLRNTNVQWMRFELDDVKDMRIDDDELDELRLQTGDLLICEGGEPGRCAIWENQIGEMYFQKALHRVRPCNQILPKYLSYNLQLDCRNGILAQFFTGAAIKHLTGKSLASYPIPIPPLEEQRRIVAKVDHLMSLVDRYESQLATARDTATRLLDALVAELTGTVRSSASPTPTRPSRQAASPDTSSGNTGHQPGPDADDQEPISPAPDASRAGARRSQGNAGTDRLLALLRKRGSLSSSDAQAATSLDPATLRGLFKTLIDQGLIRTEGQRRGMRYLPTAKAAHAK